MVWSSTRCMKIGPFLPMIGSHCRYGPTRRSPSRHRSPGNRSLGLVSIVTNGHDHVDAPFAAEQDRRVRLVEELVEVHPDVEAGVVAAGNCCSTG